MIQNSFNNSQLPKNSKIKLVCRGLWFALGLLSVGLGTLGAFLPILPTVPFLLLAMFCFSKSAPQWKEKILRQPIIGKPLREYQQYKGIRISVKIYTTAFLWTSILCSVIFFVDTCWIRILLLVIAIAVTIHVLSFRTIK